MWGNPRPQERTPSETAVPSVQCNHSSGNGLVIRR